MKVLGLEVYKAGQLPKNWARQSPVRMAAEVSLEGNCS